MDHAKNVLPTVPAIVALMMEATKITTCETHVVTLAIIGSATVLTVAAYVFDYLKSSKKK